MVYLDHDLKKYPPFRTQIRNVIFVTLSIVLFKASFPGGGFPFLAWVILVPLGCALHQQQSLYSFKLALSFAMFGWLTAVWWIIPGVSEVSGSNELLVLVVLLLFCLLYAVPYAFSAAIYSHFGWSRNIAGAFKGSLIWTTICCLTPHILPGNIAHSQYQYTEIIQVTEVGGVPLLFFLLHLCNFLLVTSFVNYHKNVGYSLKVAVFALFIPVSLIVYGDWRTGVLLEKINDLPSIEVGIVQPNISIKSRTREDWEKTAIVLYNLTRKLAIDNPGLDVIVWPEIPPPISYVQYPFDKSLIDSLLLEFDVPVIVCGHQTDIHKSRSTSQPSYNVAEFVTLGRPVAVYKKQILLPFGEYLPFERKIPLMRQFFPNASNYHAGETTSLFSLKQDIHLLPLICYEAIFPHLVRVGIELGGDVLVNPVDDAWFGESDGAEIHLALAQFRSVEFRRPIVRASNSGRSVIIDFTGKISGSSGSYESAILHREINVASMSTPYKNYGMYIPFSLISLSLFVLSLEYMRSPLLIHTKRQKLT